jgi:NADH dehydrogenase
LATWRRSRPRGNPYREWRPRRCRWRNIRRTLEAREPLPFAYRNKGDLATIGRHRAIADFGWLQLSGVIAWWFWLFLHILYLAGFRNRLSVLVEWGYSYFTYERGARLITSRG